MPAGQYSYLHCDGAQPAEQWFYPELLQGYRLCVQEQKKARFGSLENGKDGKEIIQKQQLPKQDGLAVRTVMYYLFYRSQKLSACLV